jgi:hypothetical protein
MIYWRKLGELLLPWSGWIGVTVGWGLTHQIGSNSVFDKCPATGPLPMALLGLVGLAVIAAGAFLSVKIWQRGEAESPARRFLGLVGLMLSGVFAAAVLWQTVSAFIIPQCYG